MKPYANYVDYMLRQFFAQDVRSMGNRTEAEIENDGICFDTVKTLSAHDRDILRQVMDFAETIPLREAVRRVAANYKVYDKDVWSMVRRITEEIAHRKGLV